MVSMVSPSSSSRARSGEMTTIVPRATIHDVVVVGAGPAGLFSALRLARVGRDVVVLEEHATIGQPTHCTGVVSGELEEFYKAPDDIVLHRPASCVIVAPHGATAEFQSPGESIA